MRSLAVVRTYEELTLSFYSFIHTPVSPLSSFSFLVVCLSNITPTPHPQLHGKVNWRHLSMHVMEHVWRQCIVWIPDLELFTTFGALILISHTKWRMRAVAMVTTVVYLLNTGACNGSGLLCCILKADTVERPYACISTHSQIQKHAHTAGQCKQGSGGLGELPVAGSGSQEQCEQPCVTNPSCAIPPSLCSP